MENQCECDDALGESCPKCHPLGDGKGGYYSPDHLWEGECNCESCTPPIPKADTIPCPDCKGNGGWMHAEYEVGGACVGQSFEDCARCGTSGQIPKPKPPKRDDFRCPEHGEHVTQHVALPEGGYRRVCPLCPPVDPRVVAIAANEARDEREWERKVASSK